jgi:hypothetical protein
MERIPVGLLPSEVTMVMVNSYPVLMFAVEGWVSSASTPSSGHEEKQFQQAVGNTF